MIDYSLSKKLKVQYQNANPFPYVVIDNFLPEFILKRCVEELKNHKIWFSNTQKWVDKFQVNKFYYPNENTLIDEIKSEIPITNLIFDYLNSESFIKFLEELSGFEGLFRDPNLLGGGIHKISNGGKLSIHVDFNTHPETLKKRKLNLLIYLNEDWMNEWNGNLEFWDKKTWEKKIEISPVFNRAVIFSIEDAPHGHPIELNTPDGVDRYSLALYYFTDEIPKSQHSVIFYNDEEIGVNKENDNIFKLKTNKN
jgi:Rps23 Pro-64 3,4-dihydroxylase Tpa1-like proline 4-hydroxylase